MDAPLGGDAIAAEIESILADQRMSSEPRSLPVGRCEASRGTHASRSLRSEQVPSTSRSGVFTRHSAPMASPRQASKASRGGVGFPPRDEDAPPGEIAPPAPRPPSSESGPPLLPDRPPFGPPSGTQTQSPPCSSQAPEIRRPPSSKEQPSEDALAIQASSAAGGGPPPCPSRSGPPAQPAIEPAAIVAIRAAKIRQSRDMVFMQVIPVIQNAVNPINSSMKMALRPAKPATRS